MIKGADTRSIPAMRVFFNLISDDKIIRDDDGVEINSVEDARKQAHLAVYELCSTDPDLLDDWSGWRMQAVDTAGLIIFELTLVDMR